MADLLENRSNGSIAGRLALDKPAIFASAYNHLFTKAISLWRTKFLRCTGKAKYAIQVGITTDEGQIETQHIACVEREDLTPTTLRLTLAEGKTILKALQAVVVEQQMTAYLETQRSCAYCGHLQRSKGSHTTQVRTVFGTISVKSPRLYQCPCQPHPTEMYSPLAALLPEHLTPELLFLETKWAALVSYGITAQLLQDVLPIDDTEVFRTFVRQVLGPTLTRGDIVVMDHLRAHKAVGVQQAMARRGARLLYLPPYSPDLSPIEPCWSKVKTALRKAKARIGEALDMAITGVLATITDADARGWFQHCGYALR